MLLSSRRVALLHVLLAGMQAAWISAFLLLLWPSPLPVSGAFAATFVGLLTWMLALELLSRIAESPRYDALALAGLVVSSLLLVRLVVQWAGPAWDFGWVGRSVSEAANWKGRLPPQLVIVVLNVVLWQRASAATSRELNFFSVGVTFRAGLLLLLLGGALVSGFRGFTVIGLLWIYMALGLAAVAISRVSEKAVEAQSSGRLLPPSRLLQIGIAVGAVVGTAWLASLAYTERGISGFFHFFDPLWRMLEPLGLALIMLLGQLLEPVLLQLEAWLAPLLRRAQENAGQVNPPVAGGSAGPSPFEHLPRWPFDLVRDALVVLVLVMAVLGLIGFLLLYLERVRKSGTRAENEDEGLERATFGGGILRRAAGSLRGAGGLVRRFGVGRELLAAISVQNIYANVCRIARQRGHPRPVSQPPDAYLPMLAQAFPGQEERLRRITYAYMRVHYGEHVVPSDELEGLRDDYRALRAAPPPRVGA